MKHEGHISNLERQLKREVRDYIDRHDIYADCDEDAAEEAVQQIEVEAAVMEWAMMLASDVIDEKIQYEKHKRAVAQTDRGFDRAEKSQLVDAVG